MEQPGTLGPKAESPPQSREVVPGAPRSEEPLASKPTSEPAAPGKSEKPARDEATSLGPGTSAAEPSGSSTQTVPEPSETGWVRIPNKGRIPSQLAADSDAAGEAAGPRWIPSLDRPDAASSRDHPLPGRPVGRVAPTPGTSRDRPHSRPVSGNRSPVLVRPRNPGPAPDRRVSNPRSIPSHAGRTSGRSPGCTTATAATIAPSGRQMLRNIPISKNFILMMLS